MPQQAPCTTSRGSSTSAFPLLSSTSINKTTSISSLSSASILRGNPSWKVEASSHSHDIKNFDTRYVRRSKPDSCLIAVERSQVCEREPKIAAECKYSGGNAECPPGLVEVKLCGAPSAIWQDSIEYSTVYRGPRCG